MKNCIKPLIIIFAISLTGMKTIAQDLTGTWEGSETVNNKKYNYTLYLANINNSYCGVTFVKESLIQINKGTFNLGGGNKPNSANANVNVKIDPFAKRASAKAQLIGTLTNGVFAFSEIGLIEANVQNVQLDIGKFVYSQVKNKERLTSQGTIPLELTKRSAAFPAEYNKYKKEIISVDNMVYANGEGGRKIKYNDKGSLSFNVTNNSDFDLQRISISIAEREKNADIRGLEGNNGTFSLSKAKSIIPSIDITSGFNIPADSLHFTVVASYNGVTLFARQLAVVTIPFYLNDKTSVNKSSEKVMAVLKGFYGLNGSHATPIVTGLNQFAAAGNKNAPFWKAAFLTTGNGGFVQNEAEAQQFARKAYDDVVIAARNGDAEGQYLMFYAVWLGLTADPSRDVAGGFLKKSAEAGFLPAMYDYALYLMKDNNYEESYKYLTACYDKGVQLAATTIGYYHQKGYAVSKDINKAIEWYHKGEAFGDADAMMQLANVYSSGDDGMEPDAKKAVLYATKAAALKNASAMNFLAKIYLNGRNGVPKNVPKALEMYREASTLGDNASMTSLAYIYLGGSDGITKDEKTGLFWAKKSAESGGPDCMVLLSNLYYEGKYVDKNIIKSRFWSNQARLRGVGEKDRSAEYVRSNEIANIISNIDLSDQHTLWEDSNGNHYVSNDGPDLVGGLFKSFFSAYMDRRSHQQEVINGVEYIYGSGSKKVYGGTLTSKVTTEIYLKKGQKIQIKAYGEVNLGMMAGVGNPNGIAGFQSYCVDPAIPHGAVMAGMNNQWVFIGNDNIYTAPADGKLQIAINDVDYSNNVGYFDVVATVN